MFMDLNRELFNDRDYFKKLWVISLPIIIQNLIASSVNMLDTLMVGKLGDSDIAAVGIGNQVFLLFYIMSMGISSGCGVFISQYWGKADKKNIRRVMGFSLIAVSLLATVFSIAVIGFPKEIVGIFNREAAVLEKGSSYIRIIGMSYVFNALTIAIASASRCIEKTKPPMFASLLALVFNGGLNYVFIFGKFGIAPMGVAGAGLGTLIARVVEFFVLFIYLFKTSEVLWGSIKDIFDLSLEFSKRIFDVVKDVVLNELFWGLGTVIYSIVYGRIGSGALAAVQIYNTVQNFFFILVFGMAVSSMVMIGKEIGLGNDLRAKRYSYNSFLLTIYLGVLLSIIIGVTAPGVVSLFNISEEVRHSAKLILFITAGGFTMRALNIVLIIGVLRGGGDAKFGLRTEIITMWGVGVPLALIGAFVFNLPVYGVVAIIIAEDVVKCILCVNRLFSERWIKSVT